MCYCDLLASQLLDDLKRGTVPAEALTRSCCWEEVCRVRQWNLGDISDDDWGELCTRRGHLLGGQSPRDLQSARAEHWVKVEFPK
jgi:hypothetical protein